MLASEFAFALSLGAYYGTMRLVAFSRGLFVMGHDLAERQLLLALLAFQNNFIDRPKLLAAFDAWALDRSRPLGALLVEQRAIADDELKLLEALVERFTARFDHDAARSLAHVSGVNSSLREALASIAVPDLQASLKIIGRAAAESAADPFATLAVGESTSEGSRFKILRPHAKGGLGEVFVAADGELPREVALKQIQARHADDAESRARFVQEAEITGGLEHPNIVPVYGLGTYADGRPFYAMRFIRGDSLQDAVKRYHEAGRVAVSRVAGDARSTDSASERTLQFRKLLQRFIDVCNAIDYAHSRGVLHRDLKPGNIMLGKYGETLVVDWGLAKAVGHNSDETIVSEERTLRPSGGSGSVETAYGAAIGTPAYMSPEQAAGRLDELGPNSDVYSLGATLYEVLTGQPPFKGSDLGEILRNVEQGNFPSPRSIRREIARPLEAICLKAMSLKPSDRYQTARALADDIEHWLADEPTTAYRETFQERAARWSRTHRTAVTAGMALTATAVVALVVGLVAVSAEQRETEKQRQAAENQRIAAEQAQSREAEQRRAAEAAKTEEAAQRKLADEQRQLAEQRKTDADNRRDEAIATLARSNYFLADARWKAGRVAEARELLAAVHPELRHFEWRLARREYQGSDVTLTGHTEGVQSVAFSPDGTRLASASYDRTVKLWDARTGGELRTLTGHANIVTTVTFSPDGTRLASASWDTTVKLWDTHTGVEIRTLTGHEGVQSVAFSPDGARLASASRDSTVKLWDARTGEELRTLTSHTQGVVSVAFSPDGARLASASADGTIKLWDARTGEELRTLTGHAAGVQSLAFSPDGARLASASRDNTVKLWDARTGEELRTLTGHTSSVDSVAFSPDGARLASASFDNTIKQWDAWTGEELRTLTGHTSSVESVAFSPDGARLASASLDHTIKLWDARTGEELRTLTGHAAGVQSLAFSPDGARLASASRDNTVKLWDARTGEELRTLTGHTSSVDSVAFSPDGAGLASASGDFSGTDHTVKLWDAQMGTEIRTLAGHTERVTSVAFSHDGARLASASWDKSIKLWDARTGEELRTLAGHTDSVLSVAFSPDGARLASASWDDTIKLWDASSGKELRTLTSHTQGVVSVAFSPDGARLASASADGTIKLWDAHSGEELRTLTGHTDSVLSVAFSPDGARLASASRDNTVKLWDAHSGEELRTLNGHSDDVTSVAFSPNGERLASASSDDMVKLWDARSEAELRTLIGHSDFVRSVAFSPDGARLFSKDSSEKRIAWNVSNGERISAPEQWPDFLALNNKTADGRWLAVPSGKHVLLVDLEFKNTPDEKGYREHKARLDPWWHAEQARAADLNTPIGPVEPVESPTPQSQIAQQAPDNSPKPDWYAAAFHWAWVVKANLDKPEKAEQLKEARERLKFCDAKWRVEFAARMKEAERIAAKGPQPEKPPTPVSTNPDDYLAPIVKEMLKK